MEKLNTSKKQRLIMIVVSVAGILLALFVGWQIGRRGINEQLIFGNLTADWQSFKSSKYGFSFKYPNDWVASENTDTGIINLRQEKNATDQISFRVKSSRVVDGSDPIYAIQLSIPFDKANYIILSTSADSLAREIFYTIPMTIERQAK